MGTLSRDFNTNLAPQCKAFSWDFSRALNIEKLIAPLFRGHEGAGDTNDWCITFMTEGHRPVIVKRAVISSKSGWKLSTIFKV